MSQTQTTVKTGSVSESEQAQDQSPTGEQALKELENKIRTNLRAEYEEKTNVVRAELEKANARLEELDEQVKLSKAEQEEQRRLNSKVDTLEGQLQIFESNPEYAAAREHISRRLKKSGDELRESIKLEVKKEIYNELVDDFVNEHCEEEKMKPDEFRIELNKYLKVHHMNLVPTARIKAAYKEYKKSLADAQKNKELLEKEQKFNSFTEKGNGTQRETSVETAKKEGDFIAHAAALGI